jgi:transcriptional regulator with XRE-family HTH domain
MCIVTMTEADPLAAHPVVRSPLSACRPLHQLALVRRREGVSRRSLARQLGITAGQVEQQERESADLKLSTLYAWQKALNVPIQELLVEGEESVSAPVLRRAQFLRMMKTVRTILDRSKQIGVRRMAQMLAEQLTEAMPELDEVGPWPVVGKRRRSTELGQVFYRRLDVEFHAESEGEGGD